MAALVSKDFWKGAPEQVPDQTDPRSDTLVNSVTQTALLEKSGEARILLGRLCPQAPTRVEKLIGAGVNGESDVGKL